MVPSIEEVRAIAKRISDAILDGKTVTAGPGHPNAFIVHGVRIGIPSWYNSTAILIGFTSIAPFGSGLNGSVFESRVLRNTMIVDSDGNVLQRAKESRKDCNCSEETEVTTD